MIINILTLLTIQLILVYIIDLSGVMISIKRLIWRILVGSKTIYLADNIEFKPFTCSKCMTWWISLLFILFFIPFTNINILIFWIGYAALLSYMSTTSLNLLILIKDTLDSIIIKLNDMLNK